jgi:VanZ family protein
MSCRLPSSGSTHRFTISWPWLIAAAFWSSLIIGATLFAVSDEYHQTFVPGRGGTATDVAIDGLGIVLAAMIAWNRRATDSSSLDGSSAHISLR